MKINQLITILFLLIVSVSCKKDPIQYTFEGTITENQFSGGLDGVAIKMYQVPFSNTVTSNNLELAASTSSSSSGEYNFNFERKKVTEFKMTLSKSGYFDSEFPVNVSDVSSENVNVIDYEMEAKAWVKINIQNTGLADPSDNLTLILFNYRAGCEGCATNDYNYFPGVVDTSLIITSNAGEYFRFIYSITGSQSVSDSVYLTPFDTTSYSITY